MQYQHNQICRENRHNYVELTGVVFGTPEYIDGGVGLQMMADIENYDNNTIVYIWDEDFDVSDGDYLHITGTVGDVLSGTNAFGAELNIPTVTVDTYELLDYKDAVAPTRSAYTLDSQQTQYGYCVTLQQIEFSDIETRLYFRIDNNGNGSFSVYSFNAYITQAGKQYSEQSNWQADYPEIQTDLRPGNYTEGIIVFPPLEEQNLSISLEAYSDNWEEDLQPFTFDITFD